jgi:hypothetical protein
MENCLFKALPLYKMNAKIIYTRLDECFMNYGRIKLGYVELMNSPPTPTLMRHHENYVFLLFKRHGIIGKDFACIERYGHH